MVARHAFVTGRGRLDLLSGTYTTGPATPVTPVASGTVALSSNLESATVANPIGLTDMRSFIGANYGGATNYQFTSVVSTTGPTGATSKVLNQHIAVGTWGMPGGTGNGTGIALTSTPLAGGAVDEASIEFDIRFVGSGQWDLGGKIPGLGGLLPGQGGGIPTGGTPSIYGWSGRSMFRRNNAAPTVSAAWVGYVYDPTQPANQYGQDRTTGQLFTWNTWVHVKQAYKMNTVTTDGSTTPPANGVHRMWFNGNLVFESTTQVFRYYQAANITGLVWDNFVGGNDVSFAAPNDFEIQFDNLVITTGAGTSDDSAAPVGDVTAPTIPTNIAFSNVTDTSATVTWTASTDAVGVQRYSVKLDGTTVATPTATTVNLTSLAPSTAYAVRVQARDVAGNYSNLSPAVTLTTTAAASTAAANLFTTQVPTLTDLNDGTAIVAATQFASDVDGNVIGVRLYRAATAPTSAIGLLYTDAGVELARATFGSLSVGWNSVTFATPVPITAGVSYRAAYWSSGPYVATSGFFATPLTNGHLTGTAGYYIYSPTPAYPSATGGASFFADVSFLA